MIDRLLKICERFRQRSEVRKAAAEQSITGPYNILCVCQFK